jgi:hypothetical protein
MRFITRSWRQMRELGFLATFEHPPAPPSTRMIMQTFASFACGIVAAAMMASASGAYAQGSQLSVPNLSITPAAVPVEPPYMRDPWQSYARNPYFGRYRVEEDEFPQVPCTQTRIAFGPGGTCLLGYRLGIVSFNGWRGSSTCLI